NYRQQCQDAESAFKHELFAHVAHYQDRPTWRLYLFEDRVFASQYSPEEDFEDSREGPVVAFSREHPFYDWLYREFRTHCPPEWKNDQARTAAIKAGLSVDNISQYAHQKWEERIGPLVAA